MMSHQNVHAHRRNLLIENLTVDGHSLRRLIGVVYVVYTYNINRQKPDCAQKTRRVSFSIKLGCANMIADSVVTKSRENSSPTLHPLEVINMLIKKANQEKTVS